MNEVDKKELRLLANAATHDIWYAGNAYDKPFIAKYQVIADTQDGRYVLLEGNQNFLKDAVRNVEFVGAANPAAILSLLDELEENNGVIAVWRGRLQRAEADLEKYRKDAERYRWLRDQEAEQGLAVLHVSGWERAATCWATTYPDAEMLDSAIDAEMAKDQDQ